MSTEVDYYTKQRSKSQLPQRRHQHLDFYDIITQDQHYQDLVNLAAKFRYNKLDRQKMFVLNGMLQSNQLLQTQIEKYLRRGTIIHTEKEFSNQQGRESVEHHQQITHNQEEKLQTDQRFSKKRTKIQ